MPKKVNRNKKTYEKRIENLEKDIKKFERKEGLRRLEPSLEKGHENLREKFLDKKRHEYMNRGMKEKEAEEIVKERKANSSESKEASEKIKKSLMRPMSKEEAQYWVGKRRVDYSRLKNAEENFKKTSPQLYKKTEEAGLNLKQKDKIYSNTYVLPDRLLKEALNEVSKGKELKKVLEEKKIDRVNEFRNRLNSLRRKIEKLEKKKDERAINKKKKLEEKASEILEKAKRLKNYKGDYYEVKM